MLHQHDVVQTDLFVHSQNIFVNNFTGRFPNGSHAMNFSEWADQHLDEAGSFAVGDGSAVVSLVGLDRFVLDVLFLQLFLSFTDLGELGVGEH